MNRRNQNPIALIIILLSLSICAYSQTTEFTYQGSLKSGGTVANGNYDFEFALFDSLAAGAQIGSTVARSSVAVADGNFSVKLDFGASFPGANRFLEIRVRQTGGGTFTPLAPRQQINSSPYAVKSVNADSAANATNATTANNALQLGGVAASQYVVTGDARLSDARTPTAGSANYIQNQSAAPQASSNFNISGTGTANIMNAAAQYNINGNRILSNAGAENLFVGVGAGSANTNGVANAFFGVGAGSANTIGGANAFFGKGAGFSNTVGDNDAFFGTGAGQANTTGDNNAFFGGLAGFANSTGFNNSFFGPNAGSANTTGVSNTFVGLQAGDSNTTGGNNTIIGVLADVGSSNLTNATAIGAGSLVTQSNSLILGGINGINGMNADTNVGIGTTAPSQRLHVVGNGLFTGDLTVNGLFTGSVGAGNITGTLGPANGGTGLSAPGTSGNFLRSNGTAWTSSALAAGDIPSGSANYIQNQSAAPQASSNFNISGNGIIGGNVGIGTSTPNARLQIIGSTKIATSAALTQANRGNLDILSSSGAANLYMQGLGQTSGINFGVYGTQPTLYISHYDGTTYQDRLTIIPNGNIGLGTSVPTEKLHVFGNGLFTGNLNVRNVRTEDSISPTFSMNFTAGVADEKKWRNYASANALSFTALNDAENSESHWLFVHRGTGATITSVDFPNGNVGIGTSAPSARLQVAGNTKITTSAALNQANRGNLDILSDTGNANFYMQGAGGTVGVNFGVTGNGTGNPTMFIAQYDGTTYTNRLRLNPNGTLEIYSLGAAGATPLCQNALFQISTCSSSARYKTNINPFGSGLELIRKLHPVSFNWKVGGMRDMGLVAEDVAAVEPLLTTTNDKGEIEGVKYDRVGVVLVNAVNEQQQIIENQQRQIEKQQRQISELTKLVCLSNKDAEICREQPK